MASVQKMARVEVASELLRRRSTHYEGQGHGEAYDFNIKMRNISAPEVLRRVMTADEVDIRLEIAAADRLRDFVDMMRGVFPWVQDGYPTGRSGGWLTVIVKPGWTVFKTDDELTTLKEARRRLHDVEWIAQKLEREKRNLIRDAATNDFWGIRKQDWTPRR